VTDLPALEDSWVHQRRVTPRPPVVQLPSFTLNALCSARVNSGVRAEQRHFERDQDTVEYETSILRRFLKSLPGNSILRPVYRSLQRVGSTGEHWARVVMNHETREIISGLSPGNLKTLEISGSWWQEMPFRGYKSVQYPDFDICESSLEETFDLIIAEQVFEHLLWPYQAVKNVYKMLNPNGYFLVTTPFLIRVHNYPTDCSRWTETGLKHFLAESGFSIDRIRTGAWGNRGCVRANFYDWKLYRPLFHSLKNEPAFPVVVWALAQK